MLRLCALDDVPDGDAIGVEEPGGELVVVRKDGLVRVYRNECPHLGIELNFQPDVFLDSDHQYIQCANHGALFQVEDGLCVYGPCQGQSLVPINAQVVDGGVWIDPPHARKD